MRRSPNRRFAGGLMVFALAAALCSPAHALDVSGTLAGGEWSLTDSPVRVVGDIELPAGARLDVRPGVRVEFTGAFSFTVRGLLDAAGTADRPVVFTASDPGIPDNRWKGIRFINAARNSRLHFCRIEYGWARGTWPENCGGGIYIERCSPTISRTVIENNRSDHDGGGIYGWFTSSLIRNTLLVTNRAGNHGGGVFLSFSNPQILNSTVALDTARGWGGGVFCGAEAKPEIVNSILTNNTQILFLDDNSDDNNLPSGDPYKFMADLGKIQSAAPEVSFSAVSLGQLNPLPGSGNLSPAQVQFVNITRLPFDFRLRFSSPCVDGGDPRMNASSEPDILINRLNIGHEGGTERATRSLPVIYNDRAALRLAVVFDTVRTNSQSSFDIKVENQGHYRLYLNRFKFTPESKIPNPDAVWQVVPSIPDSAMAVVVTDARVGGIRLITGDRIAAFTPSGVCAGRATVDSTGFPLRMTLYHDLPGTPGRDGFVRNDTLRFRMWNAVDSLAYRAQANFGSDPALFVPGGSSRATLELTIFPDLADVDGTLLPAYQVAPVEPGESAKFTLQFRPTELGTHFDTLTITSSDNLFGSDSLHPAPFDTTQRQPRLFLRGTGIDPVAVADSALAFGTQQIDLADTLFFMIRNNGRSDLRLRSVSVQQGGFAASILDGVIAPSASGRVRVIFTPRIPEPYEKNMTVVTNDRSIFVKLTGRGVGPKLSVADTSRFIGYVYAGSDTARSPLSVTNEGDEPLVITGMTVNAVTGPASAFSAELPPGGLTIPRDSTGTVILRFHPGQAGQDYVARLRFESNYPLARFYRVSGRGMAEPGQYRFGQVSGVWGWTAGSPDYIVLDSVIVPAHERLRIMPGARVLFEPGAYIRANGELRALGLPGDSIYFLPRDNSGTVASRWRGLVLENEDGSRLTYAVVSGARQGVRIRNSSPVIQYSRISGNVDTTRNGGGINLENSGATIGGSIIESNRANMGGGIFVLNSRPVISNCLVRNNTAREGGGFYFKFLSSAVLQSNLVYGNSATLGGGIVVAENSAPRILNNTIVANIGGGIAGAIRSVPSITNTIVYNNGGPSLQALSGSSLLVSYCNVEGGYAGQTNLDVDAGFDLGSSLPYALGSESPLIDRGNPERTYRDYSFPPSLGTSRNDIGAYGGPHGGGWQSPDISVALFQNPAFPHWIDVVLTSLEPFTSAPVCSAEYGGGAMTIVPLAMIDAYNYRGRYEAPGSGPLFLTAEGDISGGQRQKVGRDFEIILTTTREGGYGLIPGIGGTIQIPAGAVAEERWIVSGIDPVPVRLTEKVVFLSQTFTIESGRLSKPMRFSIPISDLGLPDRDMTLIGIYRIADNGIARLDGKVEGGAIIGFTNLGGRFALGMDLTSGGEDRRLVPDSPDLLQVWPNPFNSSVTIEYRLPETGYAALSIWSLDGRKLASLIDGNQPAGRGRVVWNGRDHGNLNAPSGVYWLRLETGHEVRTAKLLLVR